MGTGGEDSLHGGADRDVCLDWETVRTGCEVAVRGPS
jgi:hypothetical protein